MIRNHTSNDIEKIIDIYKSGSHPTHEEIENIRNSKKILVYDDNGIKGFIHLTFKANVTNSDILETNLVNRNLMV